MRATPEKGIKKLRKNDMPIEEDRHLGKRENIWFPFEEHAAMLAAMEAIRETNKSNFIRSAVRNFINALNEEARKNEA